MAINICSEEHCPISKTHCPGRCIFADILENVHTGIIGFDLVNEAVVYQNSEAAKIFREIKARDYHALMSLLLPDLEKLIDMGAFDIPMSLHYGDRHLDYTVYRTSGEYVWLFIRDVTVQKWAEEKLKEDEAELQRYTHELEGYAAKLGESEEKFRGMASAAMDAIVMLDNRGLVTYWNEAAEKLFGYTSEEAVGMEFHSSVTPGEYYDAYKKGFSEFVKTGGGPAIGETFEFTALRKGGERFPIEVSTSAIKLKDEWHAVGIIRDITARKRTEEKIAEHERMLERYTQALERYAKQLDESREKFSGIAVAATDSIIVMDENGLVTYWNPAAERMFGYEEGEAFGKEVHVLFAPARYHDAYRDGFAAFVKSGRGPVVGKTMEFAAVRKDGAEFPIEVSVSGFKVGGKWHAVGIVRDITERKMAESMGDALNVMNNIGYVFSGIRHEIGNPINSVKTTLSVLRNNIDKYSQDTTKVYLERGLEELGRVEYLLRSLKSYNMYESPDLQSFRVVPFMEKFVSLVKDDFGGRGIRIDAVYEEGAEWASADPRALNQVLLNIFTNASDALEKTEGPVIEVRVSKRPRRPGGVVISVKDNGCGIPEEHIENIFKPFYTTKAKGTGLGLVIVKKMLTKMRAAIDIESARGGGTTVAITLPEGNPEPG